MANRELHPSNLADLDDIVVALRLHAFDDCGERDIPTHIANIAADEIERLRAALQQSRSAVIEECARVAYIACAETRHVTLGEKVAKAIRALAD